jgi:flagellar biosynthetic protein FlhB
VSEDSDMERSEPASPRRLEKSREEGQVPRSTELSTFAILTSAGGGLWLMSTHLSGRIMDLLREGMKFPRAVGFDSEILGERLLDQSLQALAALAPFLILTFLVALVAPLLLSGWLFSWKALTPDFNRINPLKGLARIFSLHGLAELVKALLKAMLIGAVAAWTIWQQRKQPSRRAFRSRAPATWLSWLPWFLVIAGSMALIAAIDVPFRLWDHHRKLKMTKEEVRQENKETEGDPHIKGRIRAQQRAMARKRMMAEIPSADVIVTNPTHYSIALKYEEGKMRAPSVVAKGAHLLALRIREIAREHNVPVLEAPPLARALYHHAELGDEIPQTLYNAVAEVLAYIYQLRRYRKSEESGKNPGAA